MIVDEFGGGLIEGLSGHPSLERLCISFGSLSNSNGRLGNTLMKVLKHPNCRLKCLDLVECILDDKGISIICDSLMHNNTLKRLFLSNTQIGLKQITSVGLRALSTFIRHPNCKLVELGLYSFGINDEGIGILGSAVSGSGSSSLKTLHLSSYNSISSSLRQIINDEGANLVDSLHGSSLKALNLSYNEYISSAGWQRLFNQLSQSQTQIESMGANDNNIGDNALSALASISTLKSLDLRRNKSITPTGWQSFFDSLQTRGTQLVELDISGNKVGDVGISALGNLLSNTDTLTTLNVGRLADENYINDSDNVTSQGWQTLFTTLQDSNLDLLELHLDSNQIDDRGLHLLVPLVSSMSSLKHLSLDSNRLVTPIGWQVLAAYLHSPNLALEDLHLDENRINDDTVLAFFTNALAHNKTLKQLLFGECYDADEETSLITEKAWEAVSTVLCNKTSIMDTYNSNHTLYDVFYDYDNDHKEVNSYLDLNENKDKAEVARQKILQTHFSGSEDDDTSKMQELLDMDLEMMPTAIAWIGRPKPTGHWGGTSVSGLTLMYNLMRRLPDLFDSNAAIKKSSATKRKRDM